VALALTEKPVLSLIIPTFNEGQNIPELFERIGTCSSHISLELIVVDDNSPDGTAEIAERLNSKYGNVQVCKRAGKLGLSSAVLCGFNHARGSIVAVIDADMQHPPEIIPKMYEAIATHDYDLVIASRYVRGGKIEDWKSTRKICSLFAILFAHIFLPNSRKIKDVTSGCFMIKKNKLNNAELNPIGFKILLEIVSKIEFNRVFEIPFVFTNRLNGKSNLNDKEIKNYLIHIGRLFYYSRLTHINGRRVNAIH
jgi:dolichol-phosphate mannosyltransferase